MAVKSASDKVHTDLLGQQVRAERVASTLEREALAHIQTLQTELIRELARIDPAGTERTDAQQRRLKRLHAVAFSLITETYNQIASDHDAGLREYSILEHHAVLNALNDAIGIELGLPTIDQRMVRALIGEMIVEGATGKEWWDRQKANRKQDFLREMRIATMAGESLSEMMKRLKPKGGWGKKARREAETQVRTNVAQVMNEVRRQTYEDNADLINAVEHTSTLDRRTSQVCISRDGLQWEWPSEKPIGHRKDYLTPPLHFRCRSTIAPILKPWGALFGGRKKGAPYGGAFYRRGLETNIPKRKNETDAAYQRRIDSLLENNRASMDGPINFSKMTMAKWIKENPGRAEASLGPGKLDLFLRGKISLTDLTDQRDRPLSLAELARLVKRRSA